ncbi:MAG TPA: hypothetical protein VH877_16845 [Polyangia bacterium]|nr:hypothetical protein [Polyangia bacterium]
MGPKTPSVLELVADRNGTTPPEEGVLGTEGTLYAMPAPSPAAVANTAAQFTVTGIAAAVTVPAPSARPAEAPAAGADKDVGWASTMSLPAPSPAPPPASPIAAPPALVASPSVVATAPASAASPSVVATSAASVASPAPLASPPPAASPSPPASAVTGAAFANTGSAILSVASLAQDTALPTLSAVPPAAVGRSPGAGLTQAFDPAALPAGSGTGLGRALRFAWHMLPQARRCKALWVPAGVALLLVAPLSLVLGRRLDATDEEGRFYAVLLGGVALLYPIVWVLCSALAPLLYEEVMGARADLGRATGRVVRSFVSLWALALLSPLLALPAALARERRAGLGRLFGGAVESVWATATYALLPALLIEKLSLGEALRRARALVREAPAGVGPAVVGSESLALYSLLLLGGLGAYGLAFLGFYFGSEVHPVLGAALVFGVSGLYWTLASWMTVSYSTCFYLWVCECLRHGAPRRDLAPPPLRAAWGMP